MQSSSAFHQRSTQERKSHYAKVTQSDVDPKADAVTMVNGNIVYAVVTDPRNP